MSPREATPPTRVLIVPFLIGIVIFVLLSFFLMDRWRKAEQAGPEEGYGKSSIAGKKVWANPAESDLEKMQWKNKMDAEYQKIQQDTLQSLDTIK